MLLPTRFAILFTFLTYRFVSSQPTTSYPINAVLGPVFHGVGGVSAGASTRMLFDYDDPSTILDFLFLPSYGAALQSLKVEIGGGGQSTEGSEASHSYSTNDMDCSRGYEFQLMVEAKKRNPSIWVGGLPWVWPAYIGAGQRTNPYRNTTLSASYITSWVKCAKEKYGVTVDFIGGWNERTENAQHMKSLRTQLDAAGFPSNVTHIVCGDGVHAFNCASLIRNDPDLKSITFALGGHGPTADPLASASGLPLWNNEAHFQKTDGSDWATLLNTQFLTVNVTGIQAWALISAYDNALSFSDEGMMRAYWPTSGHYETIGRLWVTAHTTQFTQPRSWHFLANVAYGGSGGSGYLQHGGSYISYYNPVSHDWSCVIAKMVGSGVVSETATFVLSPGVAQPGTSLTFFLSTLSTGHADNDTSTYFVKQPPLVVAADGTITILITPGQLLTLTTLQTGARGEPPVSPPAAPFPNAYSDDFNKCAIGGTAKHLADQNGIFQCVDSGDASHGIVLQQMVPEEPITWRPDETRPHSILGNPMWRFVDVSIDFRLQSSNDTAAIGVRCSIKGAASGAGGITAENIMPGLYVSIGPLPGVAPTGSAAVAFFASVANVTHGSLALAHQVIPMPTINTFHTLRFVLTPNNATAYLDGVQVLSSPQSTYTSRIPASGWIGIASGDWGQFIQFDNLHIIGQL